MSTSSHLLIQAGPDKGRTFEVPPGGVLRLGRASGNDIALADPILSRHHCRLDHDTEGRLRVTDLDSANGTLVNGKAVSTMLLKTGDQILIGDTLIVVSPGAPAAQLPDSTKAMPTPGTSPTPAPEPPTVAPPAEGASTTRNDATAPSVIVDLGFEEPGRKAPHSVSLRPILWVIGAAALLLLGAALIMRMPPAASVPEVTPLEAPDLLPLVIHYEKVEGTSNSVFRYEMTLDASRLLAIAIDDLAENRHVRDETYVATNLVRELAREIDRSGFLALADSYDGIAPRPDLLNTWEITIIMGRSVKRCRVANRVEPSAFQAVRERLETFGMNELGIWAIQFSRERLVELAAGAFTRARNTFDERGIAHGNTSTAIKLFREATFYLETIDPKPEFYGELVSLAAQAEEELNQRYEEQRFRADRALNLREWGVAAGELRILREMIPDPEDPRHIEATRKLLDVENRLKTRGRP